MADDNIKISKIPGAKGEITLYTIVNRHGFSVTLSSLDAAIVSIVVPDRYGRPADVVVSHNGFNSRPQRIWKSEISGDNSVKFTIRDIIEKNDHHEISMTYVWNEDNSLELHVDTSCAIIEDIINSPYFNLDGNNTDDISHQTLWLGCSRYIPVDKINCTKESFPVAGTPMDFTTARKLGYYLVSPEGNIGGNGFWLIDDWQPGAMYQAATLASARSGRQLDIFTTLPAISVATCRIDEPCVESKPCNTDDISGFAIECVDIPGAYENTHLTSYRSRDIEPCRQLIFYEFKTMSTLSEDELKYPADN